MIHSTNSRSDFSTKMRYFCCFTRNTKVHRIDDDISVSKVVPSRRVSKIHQNSTYTYNTRTNMLQTTVSLQPTC